MELDYQLLLPVVHHGLYMSMYNAIILINVDNNNEKNMRSTQINIFCFSEMNFKGNSLCLFPDDDKKCYPGFYPKVLQDLSGTINSARKGCFKN